MGAATNQRIQEVWQDNLEEEFGKIRELLREYKHISMDTEFPGVVARPIGKFESSSDYHYQLMRSNVDILKLIQLGLTLSDRDGNLPSGICTWQFNFKFSLLEDMYAQDSIDLLTNSGIDFSKNEEYGIEVAHFAELLIESGMVLLPECYWISYHSGYDFGYLIKILTNQQLPSKEAEFFEMLDIYFPRLYDIKYLMKGCKIHKSSGLGGISGGGGTNGGGSNSVGAGGSGSGGAGAGAGGTGGGGMMGIGGGLQDIAEELNVVRIGMQHQAGSDSLLTAATFFKLRERYFENIIDNSKYLGHLYGLEKKYY